MNSLNHITYDIHGLLRNGQISDDDDITDQIKFWVINTRAQLIRQDLEKGRTLSDNIKQTITCMEVETVDASVCCSLQTDCMVLRTKLQIPKPVELHSKDLINRVGQANILSKAFSLIPYERAVYSGNISNVKSLKPIKAFVHNRYIYIMTNGEFIETIYVQGVFEDPTELKNYARCGSTEPCYTDDSAFPISAHMIETLKQMIIQTNGTVLLKTLQDEKNDANDATEGPSNTRPGIRS